MPKYLYFLKDIGYWQQTGSRHSSLFHVDKKIIVSPTISDYCLSPRYGNKKSDIVLILWPVMGFNMLAVTLFQFIEMTKASTTKTNRTRKMSWFTKPEEKIKLSTHFRAKKEKIK